MVTAFFTQYFFGPGNREKRAQPIEKQPWGQQYAQPTAKHPVGRRGLRPKKMPGLAGRATFERVWMSAYRTALQPPTMPSYRAIWGKNAGVITDP
jgi:hypothetical protein